MWMFVVLLDVAYLIVLLDRFIRFIVTDNYILFRLVGFCCYCLVFAYVAVLCVWWDACWWFISWLVGLYCIDYELVYGWGCLVG